MANQLIFRFNFVRLLHYPFQENIADMFIYYLYLHGATQKVRSKLFTFIWYAIKSGWQDPGWIPNETTRFCQKMILNNRVVSLPILKVYSNELFLFQLTNNLCTSFTKLIIILFLSKAVFIKKNFVISIFCAKNRTTINVLF